MEHNFPILEFPYNKSDLIFFLTNKPKNLSLDIIFHKDDSCHLIYSICDDKNTHLFIYYFEYFNGFFLLKNKSENKIKHQELDQYLQSFFD